MAGCAEIRGRTARRQFLSCGLSEICHDNCKPRHAPLKAGAGQASATIHASHYAHLDQDAGQMSATFYASQSVHIWMWVLMQVASQAPLDELENAEDSKLAAEMLTSEELVSKVGCITSSRGLERCEWVAWELREP
eukprot:402613-Pelagomonas_calceolata.AAC.2